MGGVECGIEPIDSNTVILTISAGSKGDRGPKGIRKLESVHEKVIKGTFCRFFLSSNLLMRARIFERL